MRLSYISRDKELELHRSCSGLWGLLVLLHARVNINMRIRVFRIRIRSALHSAADQLPREL